MKVVQIVVFPLDDPKFGGQIRCWEINKRLRSLGHQVETLTVSSWEGGSSRLGPTLHLNSEFRDNYLGDFSHIFPALAMESYFTSIGAEALDRQLEKLRPDIVWFEHAYLFSAVQKSFERRPRSKKPHFVYSAHNVEHILAKQIGMRASKFKPSQLVELVELTREQEVQAAAGSDLVVTVTKADEEVIRTWTSSEIVVCPNGANSVRPTHAGTKSVEAALDGLRFALYVASGHDPNYWGFVTLLHRDLSALPLDFRIVVAGSVSHRLVDLVRKSIFPSFANRLILLSNVSDNHLAALKEKATAIILPVLDGGGSNLKTAEALLSGKPVVGTSKSFVGFEAYKGESGVFIDDSSDGFLSKLLDLAQSESVRVNQVREMDKAPISWEKCLEPLKAPVNALGDGND